MKVAFFLTFTFFYLQVESFRVKGKFDKRISSLLQKQIEGDAGSPSQDVQSLFAATSNYALFGFNHKVHDEMTEEECLQACISEVLIYCR